MDWHNLYFGHVSPREVQEAVKDPTWQALRCSIKGLSLAGINLPRRLVVLERISVVC